MGKKNRQVDEVEVEAVADDQVEGTEVEASEEVVADAPTSRGRAILLTDPDTNEQVARKDVIKAAYEGGMTRSEIKKMLAEKYGHEVAYQIVFAATKNLKAPAKAAE